jgi:hypothetical protein
VLSQIQGERLAVLRLMTKLGPPLVSGQRDNPKWVSAALRQLSGRSKQLARNSGSSGLIAMNKHWHLVAVLGGLLAGGLAVASAVAPAQESAPAAFTFGLFGDLAYSAAEEPLLANVLADLDRTPLAFVAHVGDLGSPRGGSCTQDLWARRHAQFEASSNPLIYTPGDNEWTDCHEQQGYPGGDPLERLPKLRSFFFAGDSSFGRRTIALTHQSEMPQFAKYRENVRFDVGGITFLTLHVVGSNNGRGRTSEGDAEFAERNEADLAWLRAGFEHAGRNNSRAVMIMQQANIFPAFPPFPGNPKEEPSGFTELRDAIGRETQAFVKPVVLAHGDSHYFRIDKPFMHRRAGADPIIENFTRVEPFGSPFHHWVAVTVDADDPNVFTFRPRMVSANMRLLH